jgi:OmpA-OmpF porin, OOP family
MKAFKVLFSTSILIASLMSTALLQAQEYENIGNINFGGTAFFSDSERNIDDAVGLFIGGELPLANRWSLAGDFFNVDSEVKGNGPDAELDFTRIGLNYHLNQLNGWQPYFGFGFGKLEVESSAFINDFDENTFDLGFGMKRMLNNNWMLRGDYKVITGSDSNGWDDAVTVGVAYAFGQRSSASQPVAQASPTVTDRDNDGVPDAMDACRNSPAGAVVDSRGCEIDSDRDGVVDSRDNCPDTSANLSVDNNGCPILDISQRRVELVVNFDYDRSEVKPEYDEEISEFADFMKEYANTSAIIEGHTDNRASDAYNQPLSERRANAVRDELVDTHNIEADRVTAVGYGESRPISTDNTEAGHAMNRRIEAVLSVDVEEQRRR